MLERTSSIATFQGIPLTDCSLNSVPRRASSSAQYAGRGGAGNAFKDDEAALKLTRKASNEQAIDDGPATPNESIATKGKNWLFGKKQ